MTQLQKDRIEQAIEALECDVEKLKEQTSDHQEAIQAIIRRRTALNEELQFNTDLVNTTFNNQLRLEAKIEALRELQKSFEQL
jgi:predicted  nucleic acid-binding Zn-ribbon protein